jgi:hypothetical protein
MPDIMYSFVLQISRGRLTETIHASGVILVRAVIPPTGSTLSPKESETLHKMMKASAACFVQTYLMYEDMCIPCLNDPIRPLSWSFSLPPVDKRCLKQGKSSAKTGSLRRFDLLNGCELIQ